MNLNLEELAKIADIENEKIDVEPKKSIAVKDYGKTQLPKTKDGWVDGNALIKTTNVRGKKY